MCGRYALRISVPDLARRLGVEPPADLAPRYNIAPTQPVPVLRAADGGRRLELMRWGLVPAWSKGPDGRYAMHNARLEGIAGKPAFRGPVRRRRCLVPADGWYEWQKLDGRKQPWLLQRPGGTPFCFAGLWDRWERDGEGLLSCAILTAPAAPAIAHLHDRMPVVAPDDAWEAWLDPALESAYEALRLLAVEQPPEFETLAVSSHVNDARNDDPRCVEPLAPE